MWSRLWTLLGLFAVEIVLLALAVGEYAVRLKGMAGAWIAPLLYTRQFYLLLVDFILLLAIALGPRLRVMATDWVGANAAYAWRRPCARQIAVYATLLTISGLLFNHPDYVSGYEWWLEAAWFLSIAAAIPLSLDALAPRRYWLSWLWRERTSLAVAGVLAIMASAGESLFFMAWAPLRWITFDATRFVLGLFYPDIHVDAAQFELGTPGFTLTIAPQCSGYEGIGLVAIFISAYLVAFRRELRFPNALLLYPLGICLSWALNIVRLAALIAIGSSWSQEVAVAGFHGHAGLLAFSLVALGMVAAAHQFGFIKKTRSEPAVGTVKSNANAYLLPLLALLGTTLLTATFSPEFQWLYPLRVIATGIALALCWNNLPLHYYRPAWHPVFIGLAVTLLWLLLVPWSASRDAQFAARLSAGSTPAAWLAFRWLGAVVTVPLAEELAFRGYLLPALAGQRPEAAPSLRLTAWSLLVSSLAFGLLHGRSEWLAGTLAGLAYALARRRRNQVGDAVLAHAVTNLLLAAYVAATGHWSYW